MMSPTEEFNAFAAIMIGLPVSYVWRGYGSAIFIELGALAPRTDRDGSPGHPEGEVSLGVEWSWRIEDTTAIHCGSWSEEDRWEPALDMLRHARIARCELFGALPEVAITTDTGIRFLSFSTTDGQPQWHLVDRREGPDRWFTVREGQLHLGDGTELSAYMAGIIPQHDRDRRPIISICANNLICLMVFAMASRFDLTALS